MKLFYWGAIVLIFAGLLLVATRKTEAEYQHCMRTVSDKTLCLTVKP